VKLFIKSIEEGAASGKPFFSFMFFESPHHPYSFPPEAEYTKDYLEPFNAAHVTPKDGPRIFNRAANCARHLDMCLDKVFQVLEKKDLLKNTIVVLVGDHGEEFFEKGHLGHSSKFVNEQVKTPLFLYYPGIKPGVYTDMSSHLDIVPMLAKLLGVKNDPRDYSCGFDLISDPQKKRRYALIANWSEVFFAGKKYKSLIPLDAVSFAKQVITDQNDMPLKDVAPFYREYNKDLVEVQKDLSRFTSN
jgi:membrane-anchored protein YejM (alkaline phosphatase superfamily)